MQIAELFLFLKYYVKITSINNFSVTLCQNRIIIMSSQNQGIKVNFENKFAVKKLTEKKILIRILEAHFFSFHSLINIYFVVPFKVLRFRLFSFVASFFVLDSTILYSRFWIDLF